MKTFVTLILSVALTWTSGDAWAKKARSKSIHQRPHKVRVIRTRARLRSHSPATLAERSDEVTLSPSLLRKLQANLIDGGYLRGTVDGRLTLRTRRALADFQREYHLAGTGSLDRSTAEALLGRDEVSAFVVAHK